MSMGPQNWSCLNVYPSIWKVNAFEPLVFFTDNVNRGENKHVSAQQSEAGYKGISFGFLRGKHHLVVKKWCIWGFLSTPGGASVNMFNNSSNDAAIPCSPSHSTSQPSTWPSIMGCKPTNDGSSQGACSKDVIETIPPCGKTVDGRVPHVGSAAQILPQICLFVCLDQTLDLQYFDPPLFDNPDLSSLNPKLVAARSPTIVLSPHHRFPRLPGKGRFSCHSAQRSSKPWRVAAGVPDARRLLQPGKWYAEGSKVSLPRKNKKVSYEKNGHAS